MNGARGAAVLFMIAVACTGTDAEGSIVRGALGGIVLERRDAPTGTIYLASVSGPSDLESFARDQPELERLRDEGFIVGHFSLFVPEDKGTPLGPLDPGEVVVQQVAGLFQTGAGADSAMLRFVDDLKVRQIPDSENVEAQGLGALGFGLTGPTPDGETIQMFVWRERTDPDDLGRGRHGSCRRAVDGRRAAAASGGGMRARHTPHPG